MSSVRRYRPPRTNQRACWSKHYVAHTQTHRLVQSAEPFLGPQKLLSPHTSVFGGERGNKCTEFEPVLGRFRQKGSQACAAASTENGMAKERPGGSKHNARSTPATRKAATTEATTPLRLAHATVSYTCCSTDPTVERELASSLHARRCRNSRHRISGLTSSAFALFIQVMDQIDPPTGSGSRVISSLSARSLLES
jgi:hypothetical protein